MTDNNKKKKPPVTVEQSPQYDLFKSFLANDDSGVSNAIEVWESIPKYFFTPSKVKKLRTQEGLANPYKWEYTHDGKACCSVTQPALIEQKDGSYLAFFPSVTEELVEEALKKILTDQNYGMHDAANYETWVRFSLSMIHRELKVRGRERNRAEIKHAIEVMAKCNIAFSQNGKEVWSGSILQNLVTVGRDEYLSEKSDSHHIAQLPLFISRSINELSYRQFNYARLMECDGQLSRWIYKQLIHRFKQASPSNDYHFKYSTLVLESALLQQGNEYDNRKKVIVALDELVNKGVIGRYDAVDKKEGRKVIDVVYTLYATSPFVSEQMAANRRGSMNKSKAISQGVPLAKF